jgi:predicted RNase H-like nuclease
MSVAGVHGTKGGWLAVVLDGGNVGSIARLDSVTASFEELAEAEVIAIDIPIGFGPREADSLARANVGGSSVFPIPEELKFAGPFGPGQGISAQAFALGARIRHVSDLARNDPRFREVHPEVCFWAMNGERKLSHGKKTAGGVLERLALLESHGVRIRREQLGDAARAPLDDILDAAACAWTASRIAEHDAVSFPDPPESIGDLQVAIWY